MLSTLALLTLTLVGSTLAQGVNELVIPAAPAPPGCENSRTGTFTITVYNASTTTPTNTTVREESLLRRQNAGVLTLSLTGGILTDQAQRTGYIASNYQFQFDAPPQNGAIYTGGFSICANGTLALGGSALFWQCLSGDFYNLYDRDWAEHCNPIYINAIEGAGAVFSTSPNVPARTGPSTATISDPGTAINGSATGTGGEGLGVESTSTGPASASASATDTSSASASHSGGGTGASASATSSDNAAVNQFAVAAQTLLAWVGGAAGVAVAMV